MLYVRVVYAFIGDKCYGGGIVTYDNNGNNGMAIIPVSKKGICTVKQIATNKDGTLNPRIVRTATITISEPNTIVPVTLNSNYGENGEYGDLSFNETTDTQFAAIVSALDTGKLTMDDIGWSTYSSARSISISAMPATYVGESYDIQSKSFSIWDKGGATLINGKECHYLIGFNLYGPGYMNPTDTNKGSWKESARRKWCNEIFRNAIPEPIRSCFKQFKCITATEYNSDTITTTDDYFALPAVKEVFGNTLSYDYNSPKAESNTLKQFTHFGNGNTSYYSDTWTRSPNITNNTSFCTVNQYRKSLYYSTASTNSLYFSVFGCI